MGWSQSNEETVQDNGVVNNSFVVDDHNINIPLDIKVLFYVLVVAVLARDKIIKSFQILDVKYKVPTSAIESINPQIKDKDTEDSEEETVALSTIEFFNLASKLVPLEFDGSFDKLQPFLDSLALLQANSEGHADRALAFVKTRLTGKARDLINDDMTVDNILKALTSYIQGESSKVVSAKLLNLKQNFNIL
ncbi:hypothetical protein QE152_g39259 [Popillia japonica]|uniref:Uncharacterized protein n=1 Tax=Popillia japonica TaxID=7064 RepID=A0AAW1HUM7_POPJA